MPKIIKEACVENYTALTVAIEAGADRIELCDNLAVGGTTVSYATMQYAVQYCQQQKIPLMVIIHPRAGNFVYSAIEKQIMLADIQLAKQLQVNGIVFGALTMDGWLDQPFISQILQLAIGLDTTFHMAFDHINTDQQMLAIDWLASVGCNRILSHGGLAGTNIIDNLALLQQHIAYADKRIIFMPGGGINTTNYQQIVDKLAVTEIHGTKIVVNT